ncbi:MAG: HAD-IIB family hydrolase, partial [Gallionella sp.]|nr:HAD-IIB family hydrolase [Gallionella sp.]
ALAYVSGRHLALVEQAIVEYALPQPAFVIADVGATIYQEEDSGWHQWAAWDEHIGQDWKGWTHDGLASLLSDLPALRLQEAVKQNRHKLSYYVELDDGVPQLLATIGTLLHSKAIQANLIWSLDEAVGAGLLDVLPARANKLHAIRFLMREQGFGREYTVFAGDSGNDLDVLLSDIQAVLVANADAAVQASAAAGDKAALYLATGAYLGMNGNYSAGILEGVAHYRPELDGWLRMASGKG